MLSAQLILSSGESFHGFVPDCFHGTHYGEVVFNTGMVGYVETLTDPSYYGQILTFTYPLIGNYGVPDQKFWESDKIQARAVVVSNLANNCNHHQMQTSLLEWCKAHNTPIITGIDTRSLTLCLREQGVIPGAISTELNTEKQFFDINADPLVPHVSVNTPQTIGDGQYKIILLDCGVKQNILRSLQAFPFTIKRVPFDYDFTDEDYDGLFISNGPGDPEQNIQTIAHVKKAMTKQKPIFGICLGTQILALAANANTYKLRFGHRSQNQPCIELATNRCFLTSANHGYSIAEHTLADDWHVTYRNLNDETVQGIAHKSLPFSAVQFHPEACPGPVDTKGLFEKFYQDVKRGANG